MLPTGGREPEWREMVMTELLSCGKVAKINSHIQFGHKHCSRRQPMTSTLQTDKLVWCPHVMFSMLLNPKVKTAAAKSRGKCFFSQGINQKQTKEKSSPQIIPLLDPYLPNLSYFSFVWYFNANN